eukprot:8129597-Alexandrium_andersonii.AAC.1
MVKLRFCSASALLRPGKRCNFSRNNRFKLRLIFTILPGPRSTRATLITLEINPGSSSNIFLVTAL